MVVGKTGDTVQIAKTQFQTLSPEAQKSLAQSTDAAVGRIHYKTDSLKQNVAGLSSSRSRWCYRNF